MERNQVITILESLANGVDPGTGARIPLDAFHTPDAVRALVAASTMLRDAGPKPRGMRGARWTDEEDARLCRAFDEGGSIAKIAAEHGRTSAAISIRLVKLGRLEADQVKARIH